MRSGAFVAGQARFYSNFGLYVDGLRGYVDCRAVLTFLKAVWVVLGGLGL